MTIICLVWQQRLKKCPTMPSRTASVMSNISACSSRSSLNSPNDFLWDAYGVVAVSSGGQPSRSNRTSTTSICTNISSGSSSPITSPFHLPLSRSSSQVMEAYSGGDSRYSPQNKSAAYMVER